MPELPEVETAVRLLRPQLEGRRIASAEVFWPRTIGGQAPAAFAQAVVGARVATLRRRAKYIVADLERGGRGAGALLVHLRMTGRLYVEPARAPRDKFVKLELALEKGKVLRFLDVRKFGRFLFVEDAASELAALGPEPLEPQFKAQWLQVALGARKRRIKPLLLDQEFLAGMGNIYTDECLHQAGIHPLARSDRIDAARVKRLHEAIRSVLRAAIQREGSSFDVFYRTPEGQPGSYQDQFKVYGRTGKPCRVCGEPIARVVVGQRGTHFCRRCQKR
ncbi:MAG: bifunctional DNA-formamidopyrimidine glycosylase/DNA-(apurinic or apyrimidinic site) lyase [Planctomycetes bacterium]|nr:bifunctional DNA-formamidopyrimidine glycosylase/DNA-(apurinic or apyrimidinic site) lyase [Planctomycetota bacterium]